MGMAEVLDKDRMLAIEAASVVSGTVDSGGDLILTTHGGTPINAGNVATLSHLEAEDTTSVLIELTGSGSTADPWHIEAEVNKIDASAIDSGTIGYARLPQTTVVGTLHPSYKGIGPTSVMIDGDSSYTNNLEWVAPYLPSYSRRVSLSRFGSRWVIIGQTQFELGTNGHRVYGLTLGPNWQTYNESTSTSVWSEPRATRLPSGLVVLTGLIRFTNGVPAGAAVIVSGMETELRPEFEIIHYVNNSDSNKSVSIKPDGTIVVRGTAFITNGYLSLDGIAYWPANTATWIPVGTAGSSFGTGFSSDATFETVFGKPAFYKDIYGFTWGRGLVKLTTSSPTDNQVMVNLPDAYRTAPSEGGKHFRTTGADTFAVIGSTAVVSPTAAGFEWKAGSPSTSGSWMSLSSVAIPTADAFTLNTWKTAPGFINSWSRYSSSFPAPGFLRRGDGLCMTKGLMGVGTYQNRAFILERELMPYSGRLIFDTVATTARGRVDISGLLDVSDNGGQYIPGGVVPIAGGASWFSLDGLKWVNGV